MMSAVVVVIGGDSLQLVVVVVSTKWVYWRKRRINRRRTPPCPPHMTAPRCAMSLFLSLQRAPKHHNPLGSEDGGAPSAVTRKRPPSKAAIVAVVVPSTSSNVRAVNTSSDRHLTVVFDTIDTSIRTTHPNRRKQNPNYSSTTMIVVEDGRNDTDRYA